MEDISGYKVADLKQALKERGLPVAGTKAELASRLTAALATEKSADDSVIDESVLDEDLLAGDDDDEEGDDDDVDENIVLEGNGLQDDNIVTNVGIKRQASPSKTNLTATTDSKKVKLNRESVPAVPPPVGSTSPTKLTAITADNISASDAIDPSKGTVKVGEVGAISAEERAKLRQQKFGAGDTITPAAVAPSEDKRQARAARFGITATPAPASTAAPTAASKAAAAQSPENLALLEKRKARFGIEPETKQQVDEAKQKRAARFGGGGASAVPSGASDEKLKTRAARFGS